MWRIFWVGSLVACSAMAGDKSGTRPTAISVPHGPGSIEGLGEAFQVNLNAGSVSEAIALKVPPGTAGHAPRLALTYDSGQGNGALGLGWTLGIPMLQLKTEKGLPRYDGSDVLLLQGAELVKVSSGTYRLKNESRFARVRASSEGFEVDLPSGETQRFGISAEARVEAAAGRFAWYLQDELDRFGNRIAYTYVKGRGGVPYLTRIDYNMHAGSAANSVEFTYEARPDVIADYRATFAVTHVQRLTEIRMRAQGNLQRKYVLTYGTEPGLSLLRTVTMVGDDNTSSFPPLRFSYTTFKPTDQAPQAIAGAPPVLPGDSTDAELADVDGDGFPDILVAQAGHHSYARNVGAKRFEPVVDMTNSPSLALGTQGVELSDIDGDGLVDLVAKTGTTAASFRYFLSTGTGKWQPSVSFTNNPSFVVEDVSTRLVDLDFDKRPDAFRLTAASATWWHNNGDGSWSDGQSLPLPGGSTALDFADGRVKLADMNGDRLLDLVFVRSGSIMYWPSRGRGLFDAPVQLGNAPTPGTGLESRLQVADLNGDGMADLILPSTDSVDAWLLEPTGSYGGAIHIANTPYADSLVTQVRLGDLNGNGSTDIVWFTPSAAPDQRVQFLDLQSGVRPNLLFTVENGLGLVRSISYTTSADEFEVAWESKAPWSTRVPFSVQVVASTTVSDSRGGVYVSRYTYADGYYDAATREFRGFGRVEERTPGVADDPTLVVTHRYELGLSNECLKGREVATERRAADGFLFSRTEWDLFPRAYSTGADGGSVVGPEVREQREYVHEGSATPVIIKQQWTYDDFGNPLTEFRAGVVVGNDAGAANDETLIERTYANDASSWILGRMVEETTRNLNGEVVRQTRRYYDGPDFVGLPLGQLTLGAITREEAWVSGSQWLPTSRLKRDEFGNTVGSLSARGALRQLTYDPITHTLPVAESVVFSSTVTATFSATYEGSSDLLESFTDSNNHVTRFKYDTLHRLTAIAQPGDTLDLPTSSFAYTLASPVSALETATRVQVGLPAMTSSWHYVDGLGRQLGDVVQAEGGRYVSAGRKTYSPRGSVLREWDGVFVQSKDYTDTPPDSPATDHSYDALGRRRVSTFPDSTQVEVRYGQLWQETWDAEDLNPTSPNFGTPLRHEFDGQGRTVRAIEYLDPARTLTTGYVFDAAGQRRRVVDALGHTSIYDLDGLGRVSHLKHPDVGDRQFSYDDDGNMKLWVDALGNQVAREYDLASRLVSEAYLRDGGVEEGRVTLHYDVGSTKLGAESKSPVGMLSWVEDLAGEEHFAYDERGRMTADLRVADGQDHLLRQSFDDQDHLVELTYPDGAALQYQYNERGLLSAISSILTGVEYDAQGLVRSKRYANGTVTSVGYDAHDRLKTLATQQRGGNTVQDLTYHYDLAGTVLRIDDAVHPTGALSGAWQYHYDSLYRLLDANGAAGSMSQQYDDVGNITQKSNLGAYAYESTQQPNTVTAVGGRVVRYDGNGSTIESMGRSFEWAPDGKLRRVVTPKAMVDYTYDYTGRRAAKRVTMADGHSSTAVYLDKYAELRDGKLVKYVFLGDSRVARIGGSLPKVVALVERVTGPGARAVACAAMLLAMLLAMLRRTRRTARAVLAASLALSLASCNGCGGGTAGPPAGTLFYIDNHLGSTELQLDTDSKVVGESNFDVWGAPIVVTDEPFGFTGAEYDAEVGLQYLGSRYYDVQLGRFISADETVIDAPELGGEDGQLLNVYSYARNTPTSLKDRAGKLPHILAGALIGLAINTGIYLIKSAYNDTPITARGALTAAAVGFVTGAVGAATGGAGLVLASGAITGAVGGIVERGLETGSAARAFDPVAVAGDAAIGAVTAGLVKAATPLVRKVAGAVRDRLGSAVKKVVEAVAPKCAGGACGTTIGCFVAGTPVELSDGSSIPIEQLQPGMTVAAAHEANGWNVTGEPVAQVSTRQVDVVVDVDISGPEGAVERITTTLEHPFAVVKNGQLRWVGAGALTIGEGLASQGAGRWVLRIAERRATTTVYNLTVDSAHTYFIGAGQVLVHNADDCLQAAKAVGKLPKPPTGLGSVPKADRDPKRLFPPAERAAKRAEQGGQCANGCGTKLDETNSRGHHVERHADGGPTDSSNHAEVCVDCHLDLHSP
jgi:RHS repeat-associated protein